jgi:hypothetical protein
MELAEARNSWTWWIRIPTPVSELFRIDKVSRIDIVILDSLSPQFPLFETRFGLFLLLFSVFPLPYFMPHNVLYDTSGRGGVKEAVQHLEPIVNTELYTGSF